ncbi:hypothetical protein BH23PLA1_BH23PLA1_37920 [soil metagenome]
MRPLAPLADPLLILLIALLLGGHATASEVDDEVTEKPAMVAPEPGPFEVEIVDRTLRDDDRGKDLPVVVCFPKTGEGPFPVVIFSHGAGGSGRNVTPLPRFWASHGYVCIAPTHAESITLRRGSGREEAPGPVVQALNSSELWADRAGDISFLIDSLDKLAGEVPALQGRVNADRIGVGGHSLGAFTTQLIGGATIKLRGQDEPKNFADDRPLAFLLLSGQGTGQMGLHERSWDGFDRPLMGITGTLDRGAGGQGYEWRGEPFEHAPPGDKYHIVLQGAHHGSFTGRFAEPGDKAPARLGAAAQSRLEARPDAVPPARREALRERLNERLGEGRGMDQAGGVDPAVLFGHVQAATLAFWNVYLKDDAQAQALLNSEALPDRQKGALIYQRK